MSGIHIGVDLDNTIIDYDEAFVRVGQDIGLLPTDAGLRSKDDVKSFLISPQRGEQDWMRLQGQVYGRYIDRARLYRGTADFFRAMRDSGVRVSIVSHKTRFGHFDDEVSLWDAARGWLVEQNFFSEGGFGLDSDDVHFLQTRDEKVARIDALGLRGFIDDLPEVLLHDAFPARTERFWFAGTKSSGEGEGLVPYPDWTEIHRAVDRLLRAG